MLIIFMGITHTGEMGLRGGVEGVVEEGVEGGRGGEGG